MPFLSTTILAFSMSADAFAVSLGKGATLRQRPRIIDALRTGAIFGAVEATTPVIGWALGFIASTYIATYNSWIAFAVLAGIGAKMIYESFQEQEADEKPVRSGTARLVLTAIGTSIDSMAIGIGLSFMGAKIGVAAAAIGLASFTMVTIGMMAGQYLGARFGRKVELCGGLALVLLGVKIMLEHFGFI